MKKLLFNSFIFLATSSLFVNAQTNPPKLNQVDLSKKIIGAWQDELGKDTVRCFEMSLYKNAVLETMYRTINGIKELQGAISFTYDSKLDKFKGLWVHSGGQVDSYYFSFSSDKEAVWERVEDFRTNKVIARNTFIFADQDHMNGFHYNSNGVQYSSSKWIKTNSEPKALTMNNSRTDIKDKGLNQLELAKKFIGVWQEEGKKDSIRGIEFKQYGNTIISSDIIIIKGEKRVLDMVSSGYSKSENMFKMFLLWPSGNYSTRNAYFTSENRLLQELAPNFNSEKLTGTVEMIFDSPEKITGRFLNLDGTTRSEIKFIKVK